MEVLDDKEKITDLWIKRFLEGGQEDRRSRDSDYLGDFGQGGQEEDLRLAYLKDLGDCRQCAQEKGHRSMARGVPGDQQGQDK